MDQYLFLLLFALLLFASIPPALGATACPLCGGKLTKVGTVADDCSKPSKNINVWSRSICANLSHDLDSVICTRCWHAYAEWFHRWERSSELPDSFHRPLGPVIRHFPLPHAGEIKSLVVYSQEFVGTQVIESVSFWCTDSPQLIAVFRDYAREQNLSLLVEQRGRIPGEVLVAAGTELIA